MASRRTRMPQDAREPTTMTVEAYRALEAKQTTEEQFRRALRKTAFDYGFVRQYHTKFSLGSDPGFPDELWLRDETDGTVRCVIVEAKRVGKEPTEKQYDWLWALERVPGIETYWWTPADWETIHAVLSRGWLTPREGER